LLGTIEQITPLENNQVLVINKVLLYAIRLFEYKDQQLTELARYAKNKVGYATLADAQAKVERVMVELNQTAQIETPPK